MKRCNDHIRKGRKQLAEVSPELTRKTRRLKRLGPKLDLTKKQT
jgi:hypothetical protein